MTISAFPGQPISGNGHESVTPAEWPEASSHGSGWAPTWAYPVLPGEILRAAMVFVTVDAVISGRTKRAQRLEHAGEFDPHRMIRDETVFAHHRRGHGYGDAGCFDDRRSDIAKDLS